MTSNDHAEPRSVSRLLSLLASAIEEATVATTAATTDGDAAFHTPLGHLGSSSSSGRSSKPGCPTLRIPRLRRAYNILLFGGPSHEDIIAQAALEDSSNSSNSISAGGNAVDCNSEMSSDVAGATTPGEMEPLASILSSVSVASLELRRCRRYDPANALEGLVDELLVRCGGGTNGDAIGSIARALRLFMALRGSGNGAQDVDDWEVVGGHGRRVLQKLYSSGGFSAEEGSGEANGGDAGLRQRLGLTTTTAASLPVAMFFRDGRGSSAQHHRLGSSIIDADAFANELTPKAGDEQATNRRMQQAVASVGSTNRYLLPNDCVLHGDSAAAVSPRAADAHGRGAAATAGLGTVDRMPWFTDAEFCSERGIPDMSRRSPLDGYLEAVATAPLSPSAWTRLHGEAGGRKASSFARRSSGGPPAVSVAAAAAGEREKNVDVVAGAAAVAAGRAGVRRDLDLCGALRRAKIDARSPVARELRVALSFPDLQESSPTDLLEAAQSHLPGSAVPTSDRRGKWSNDCGDAGRSASRGIPRPRLLASGGKPSSFSREGFAPPWDHNGDEADLLMEHVAALELDPVGWERAEASWNDPSVPRLALASAPLATAEGGGPGSIAFELCYREHFGGALGSEEGVLAATEAQVVRRALAVLQGIPSEVFWYDGKKACMRVSGYRGEEIGRRGVEEETLPPRVAGLSPGALSSLLEEFALAGTWYRRVEEFAACLLNRSTNAGQIATAFGVELRRQLTRLQATILSATAEVNACGACAGDGSCWRARHTGEKSQPLLAKPGSLTDVLVRTVELRRALGALAAMCGLANEELDAEGGVGAAAATFPRGASLLTYLYRAAEARAASKPDAVETMAPVTGTVAGDRDSAFALLSGASAPYLAMLGRWLWSGELWAEEDPGNEFPLHCRERLAAASGGSDGAHLNGRDPWMQDGGGSFMATAFVETEGGGVPCFLDGGELAAAVRAGKLLRMLKLSSPEFYAACAASPAPPLSLVFGSRGLASRQAVFMRLSLLRAAAGGSAAREIRATAAETGIKREAERGTVTEHLMEKEQSALEMLESQRQRDQTSVEQARRIWVQGLEGDRAAAAAAAAASSMAAAEESALSTSGRGILSFLDPPTSEAEAFAATILRERYRMLEEEADARAAKARWKRKKIERVAKTRASLKVLYAEEAHAWKDAAAGIAARRNTTGDEVSGGTETNFADTTATSAAHVAGNGEGNAGSDAEEAVEEDKGAIGDGVGGWVEVTTPEAGEIATRGVSVDSSTATAAPATTHSQAEISSTEVEAIPEVADETATGRGERSSTDQDSAEEEKSASLNAIGRHDAERSDGSSDDHSDEVKFSHVTIVAEPGGKSTGAARALGSWAAETRGGVPPTPDFPLEKFSHVNIVQEPGGSSSGVSRALGADAVEAYDGTRSVSRGSDLQVVPAPSGEASGVSRLGSPTSVCDDTRGSNGGDNLGRVEDDAAEDVGSRDSAQGQVPAAAGTVLSHGEVSGPGSVESVQDLHASDDSVDDVVAIIQDPAVETGRGTRARDPRAEMVEELEGAPSIMPSLSTPAESMKIDADAAQNRGVANNRSFLPATEDGRDDLKEQTSDSPLPLEVLVRRCVREPILAQCCAVDSAALAFLVRGAGVAEHLASLRMFLLGLNSDFLRDFTLRLLDGLYGGGVDWRRPLNLKAAFGASATAAGLDSVPLFETFRYEVDPTCGGVLGSSFILGDGDESRDVAAASSSHDISSELYLPTALAYVSPVLAVPWPVGVLLPMGVLRMYGSIHRSLFRHQVVLHRLRRLRLTLRELDAAMEAVGDGRRRTSRRSGEGKRTVVSWDRGRLHWMHLFRHEMQHTADSLQTFFAEQAESGWPELRRSLSVAEGAEPSTAGGGLAVLAAAHSRYISNMVVHMFLGNDRPGIIARARIEEFYDVVCSVSRVTDGLPLARSDERDPDSRGGRTPVRGRQEDMVLPDEAFAELASARKVFDAARRGLCGALVGISAAGGGARARPLLAILGYGGYEGGDA